MADSSQKFFGRNRPPRVQIEYDVDLGGAEKMVEIPFVMGVLADLSGNKQDDPVTPVEDRDFLEIDADNFNERLKAMKPHIAFDVPNVITGEGNLKVDLTFKSMDDFSPAAVASKVQGVRQLLQARTQLDNLLTHMDGKASAEDLIAKLLNDRTLMQALSSAPKSDAEKSSDELPKDKPSEGGE